MQPPLDNAQDYYDRHSTEYVDKWRALESVSRPSEVYRKNMVANLIEMAAVQPGRQVVEIGAGTGLVLRELLQRTTPVVGTDVSIEMLRRAKELLEPDWRVTIVDAVPEELGSADLYLVPDDLQHTKLPGGRFDTILSMEVLRYIGDLERALRNVRSALAEGGVFAFSVTNRWSLGLFPIKYEARRALGRVRPDEELVQYFVTEGRIRRALARTGFRVVELRKLNCLTFNPLARRAVRTSVGARRAIEVDRRLERVPGVNRLFDTFLIAAQAS
jgi:predicted TPR repeat methyltransferase